MAEDGAVQVIRGQPLTHALHDDGYLLYRVLPKGEDEEGHWYEDAPRGDDLRVRVTLPSAPA